MPAIDEPSESWNQRWRPMDDHDSLPLGINRNELRLLSRGTLPELLRHAGDGARFAFDEFFYGQIRNPRTRKNYLHSLRVFSDWCGQRGLDLVQVMPADVGRFLDGLDVAVPTRKLHLAALRRFFDELVL